MKDFEHPVVVGLIGKGLNSPSNRRLQKRFQATLRRAGLPHVYLMLATEPKYLKNIIKCMRLMDVAGANIAKEYQPKIIKLLDRLDASAKKARMVNTIVNRGNKFVGYYLKDMVKDSVILWSNKPVF
jgi:shikimate dehydrogenase